MADHHHRRRLLPRLVRPARGGTRTEVLAPPNRPCRSCPGRGSMPRSQCVVNHWLRSNISKKNQCKRTNQKLDKNDQMRRGETTTQEVRCSEASIWSSLSERDWGEILQTQQHLISINENKRLPEPNKNCPHPSFSAGQRCWVGAEGSDTNVPLNEAKHFNSFGIKTGKRKGRTKIAESGTEPNEFKKAI